MDRSWTIEDSEKLYNLKGWGQKYFDINKKGNLVVQLHRGPNQDIEIVRVVEDVLSRGIKLPVLFRFQDILRHRVRQQNELFQKSIRDHKYQGRYLGVYPIKVNQLREVVEEILDAGEPYQFGLEAGSKGELLAVLAMNSSEALTIVNGYKDESMMRLAMLGVKLGKKVVVVIEKLGEIDLLLRAASEYGVRPMIGMRVKLQTESAGKWRTSSGEAAKFGLTTAEILYAIQQIRAAGMLECLALLHFHNGSQITDIRTIKDAVKESARIYGKLRKMGVPLMYLDCGGGLGVDYDGTHSASDASVNYTLREYIDDLVSTIQDVCRQEAVPEPNIVTESGRSLVAHHSMLVMSMIGSIEGGASPLELNESPDEHKAVQEMREVMRSIDPNDLAEAYHDGMQLKQESQSLFKFGYLSLDDKAKVENLYWKLRIEIARQASRVKDPPDDVVEMARNLGDQSLFNFSLFQSLPDSWAVGHLFPIMPIHRLDEEPSRRTAIVDITCDSDGKIAQFVSHRKAGGLLPMHAEKNGDPYYVGIFLMGAYQATMGDIHNLFGRVNEVHVFEDEEEPGGYYLEEVIHGQTVRDVLAGIQYSVFELEKMVKLAIESQVKAGAIKPREGVDMMNQYEAVMREYTYIDSTLNGPAQAPQAAPSAKGATARSGDGASQSAAAPMASDAGRPPTASGSGISSPEGSVTLPRDSARSPAPAQPSPAANGKNGGLVAKP
ncbi:MAG: biosynthetic arginine decarboxylase [Elusimicrobia bacterium]|nr:biosynthetic arginine decarboxylase [Elusimicrobiota bacterium]